VVSTRFLSKRTFAAVIALAAAALVSISILPSSNSADAAPTLADTERTLADLGTKLDAINEQHNKAAALLNQSRAKQAELLKQIAPFQAKADIYQKQLALLAAASYRGGRPTVFNALAKGDSPQTVVDQLGALDQLTRDQDGVIKALKEAKKPVEETQRKLDAEIETQAKQEQELRTRKTQLDADMAKWTALKATLTPRANRSTVDRTPPPVYDGAAAGRAVAPVKFAYAQVGKPYVFAASGPKGFDCSGLTLAAWKLSGVSMEHSSHVQYASFPKVPKASLMPGDLVFFYSSASHVGIYVGGGFMIHAPQPGQNLEKTSINTSYWQGIYKGAVRPT
jgi:cell wall-associated NlpC family hydrolase